MKGKGADSLISKQGSTIFEFDFSNEEITATEDTSADLTVSMKKIDYVKVKNKDKQWSKRYKVTFEITNSGTEDISDAIYFTAKRDDSTGLQVKTLATNNGLKAGAKMTKYFYVDAKEVNSNYTITVDPENALEESNEKNNSTQVIIKTTKL